MIFKFGPKSRAYLDSCHLDLIRLGLEAISTSPFDFSCTEGYRDSKKQMDHFMAGRSKVTLGKHNTLPSNAVHFDPFPVEYPNPGKEPVMETVKKFACYYMLAMHIRATAARMGIPIRWGGDWDGDYDIRDQTFDDLAHWELDSDTQK